MALNTILLENLKSYGIGRRTFTDELFKEDKPPDKYGVYDADDETFCHKLIETSCSIPGCSFTAHTLLEFENHYNASHRYSCVECKKVLPSPHLLDLHVQENHDSFFAVMAEKKPSYCCYIEECKEKFQTPAERLNHCVQIHKLPKDFRFEVKPKTRKKSKPQKEQSSNAMELDHKEKNFTFNNSKAKTFAKYTGRKFTNNDSKQRDESSMDIVVNDLKENLPE